MGPASAILYFIVVNFQIPVYKISSHGIKPPLLVKVIGLVAGGRGDLRPIITRSVGNSVLPMQQWTQQRLCLSIYSAKIVPLVFSSFYYPLYPFQCFFYRRYRTLKTFYLLAVRFLCIFVYLIKHSDTNNLNICGAVLHLKYFPPPPAR